MESKYNLKQIDIKSRTCKVFMGEISLLMMSMNLSFIAILVKKKC